MHDFGTIVAVELEGGETAVNRFSEALRLFTISASLGSTESLVQPGRLMWPSDLDAKQRQWAGITAATVRLSIGIEDAEDLIEDLQQALRQADLASPE